MNPGTQSVCRNSFRVTDSERHLRKLIESQDYVETPVML